MELLVAICNSVWWGTIGTVNSIIITEKKKRRRDKMCGITAIVGNFDEEKAISMSRRLKHRGPDEGSYHIFRNNRMLFHERLSIIDLRTGTQPIEGPDGLYVAHNGEIYNHSDIRREVESLYHTTCDSEVIPHLYKKYGVDLNNHLDGVFAYVVMGEGRDDYIVARDAIGVKPLYYGSDDDGRMFFSSEMKAIVDVTSDVEQFPAGHYYTPRTGMVRWYTPEWLDERKAVSPVDYSYLRGALSWSVTKRMMSDVPIGVLLSGGLDSSLIASITARYKKVQGDTLKSFSIGTSRNSPDLLAAREVAEFIGTDHHEVVFDIQEGIKALKDVIWHIETYDVTTVRASVPMYFLSRYIREQGVEVVLSGEGADEIFGGYLYFHNAPSTLEFQKETIRRVLNLQYADCLRADKSTMAFGIEVRVPFLDTSFLDVAMGIDPVYKIPVNNTKKIEKYILRMAFDDKSNPYLPESILWRQKEQFGDGVGYGWIDGLVDYANTTITDEEFAGRKEKYPFNTPETKEAYLYRKLFEESYPQEQAARTVKLWIPTWQSDKDPSGRANDKHVKTKLAQEQIT